MGEYLDLVAELPDSGDNSKEDAADKDAVRAKGVLNTPSGRDESTWSPSPKHHRVSQGGPSRRKGRRCDAPFKLQ